MDKSASPVLGVANVREAAEYYRDVLGFGLDPDDVFQPSPDEPAASTRSSNGRGRGSTFRSSGRARRREFARRLNSTLTCTSTTLTVYTLIYSVAARLYCSRRSCCRTGSGRWLWRI